MGQERQLEQAFKELVPILNEIKKFEEKYGELLRGYRSNEPMTPDERNKAASDMLNKYSNI